MANIEKYKDLSDAKILVKVEPGKTIRESVNADFENSVIFVNGKTESPDYVIQDNDLIVVRSTPGEFGTFLLVTASLMLGAFAGDKIYKLNQETEAIEKQLKNVTSNITRSVTDLPYLRGASNTIATGKTQPFFIGTNLFTPYLLNNGKNSNYRGFSTLDGIDGKKQYYNIVFQGGFNNQIIKKVFCSDLPIKTFGGDTVQNGRYALDVSSVFGGENNYIEIRQDGTPFTDVLLNEVLVEKQYNTNLKKHTTTNDTYEPLIKSLEKNTMEANITILFNGLCHINTDNLQEERTRTVTPSYSYDYNSLVANGDSDPVNNAHWVDFTFKQVKEVTNQTIERINAVYKYIFTTTTPPVNSFVEKTTKENISDWVYVSGDETITYNNSESVSIDYSVTPQNIKQTGPTSYIVGVVINLSKTNITTSTSENVEYSNVFTRNTMEQIRATANITFNKSDIKNLEYPIAIKLDSNDTTSTTGTDYDEVYLGWVQSLIFDADELNNNDTLVALKNISDSAASNSCLIGLHIEATDENEDKLDSIQIITSGVARTWNGTAWSTDKTPTSNPASWLLEVLTSDKHTPSKATDDEIDLDSFGAWFTYCDNHKLTVDYTITEGQTKASIFELITTCGRASMYRNIYGKIAVAYDDVQTNSYGVLNEQNLISFEFKKDMTKEPDGLEITYIDADNEYQNNTLVVMYNQYDSDGNFDPFGKNRSNDSILKQITISGVTSWDNAFKYAMYLMKCQRLRPKTCTAVVGREGVYFVPLTKYLVQHPSLKIGLGNAVIKNVILDETNNYITGLELYDAVTLDSDNDFNVIIQCVGTYNNVDYCTPKSFEINNYNGRTKEIEFKTPIAIIDSVIPHADDVLSYGYGVDTITSPMLVTGIEDNGNSYNITLVDYNEDIIDDTLTLLPYYTPNITQPYTPVEYIPEVITPAKIIEQIEDVGETVKGISVPYIIKLYKRATQKPTTTGISGTATFNFTTNSLTWDAGATSNGWLYENIEDGTDPVYITVCTVSGKGEISINETQWATPVLYVKNGEDGTNSAEVYNIIPSYNIVTRYQSGKLSSDDITFKFYKANESSRGEISVYYRVFGSVINGTWNEITSGTGVNVTVDVNNYIGLKCDIYKDSDSQDVPLDSQSVVIVSEGSGAISVLLSNENVTVPCDADGNVTDLTNTNTYVYVLCGAENLNYGDASQRGKFSVSTLLVNVYEQKARSSSTVTFSGIYGNGNGKVYTDANGNKYTGIAYFQLDNIGGMSADVGSRQVTIRGTAPDGNTFEIVKTQVFTKSYKGADGVNVASITLYKRFDADTVPTKPTATLKYEFVKPPVYTWLEDGTSNGWSETKPATTSDKLPLWEIHSSALSAGNTLTDTIAASEWDTPTISQLDNGLTEEETSSLATSISTIIATGIANEKKQEILDNLKPEFNITTDANSFQVDENNTITIAQQIRANITCQRQGEDLPVNIYKVNVPNGFSYYIDGNSVVITALSGAILTNGNFGIYVKCNAYDLIKYGNGSGLYTDGNGKNYSIFNFNEETIASHYFSLNYTVVKGGRYHKTVTTISGLPSSPLISDYFTWSGVKTISDLCNEGVFYPGSAYYWNGLLWNKDTSSLHLPTVLKDSLAVKDADLKNNNSDVWEYLDHLTANSIFTDMLEASLIEANKIVSVETLTNKFTSIDEDIDDANEKSENEADEALKKLGLQLSTDRTIIEGSKINTGLLAVDVIVSNYFSNKNNKITKENVTDLQDDLDSKADSSTVTEELNKKADNDTVNDKFDDINDALDTKAESEDVNDKFDEVNESLSLKADTQTVNSALSLKANLSDVLDNLKDYHVIYKQTALKADRPSAPSVYITSSTSSGAADGWSLTRPTYDETKILWSCIQYLSNDTSGTVVNADVGLDFDSYFDVTNGILRTKLIQTSSIIIGEDQVSGLTESLAGKETAGAAENAKYDAIDKSLAAFVGSNNIKNHTIIEGGKITSSLIDVDAIKATKGFFDDIEIKNTVTFDNLVITEGDNEFYNLKLYYSGARTIVIPDQYEGSAPSFTFRFAFGGKVRIKVSNLSPKTTIKINQKYYWETKQLAEITADGSTDIEIDPKYNYEIGLEQIAVGSAIVSLCSSLSSSSIHMVLSKLLINQSKIEGELLD